MTTAQKIIKYFAIAFAIFLIVSIISLILFGVYALSGVLGLKNNSKIDVSSNMQTVDIGNKGNIVNLTDITSLDIEVKYTNLIIKNGDTFHYETNNDNVIYKENHNTIKIEEKGKWLFSDTESNLIIYIPENFDLNKINIEAGAGKVEIENLNADNLDLELGAGEASISNLNIRNNTKLEGGAGRLNILDGNINNLDLDMGIGEININSFITGDSDIDAGIGILNLNLQGSKADYRIITDKGVGNLKINGQNISGASTYGEGKNLIKIDEGIGNINITVNE